MARPTKLTEERADDLAVLLGSGVPVEVAARSVGVSRRTLDRWLRQDELPERVEREPPGLRASTRSARPAPSC